MTNEVWNNVDFTLITAGDEVTIHKEAGSDSGTAKYLNMSSDGSIRGLVIMPDKNILITEINGESPTNAMTLIADKGLTRSGASMLEAWKSIKIRAVTSTTNVRVSVFLI